MELINLDQIKFNQIARQKLAAFEQVSKMESFNQNFDYLTDKERVEINLIMARTYRKYNVGGTDVPDLVEIPRPLTWEQAKQQAIEEAERLNVIRIDRINDEQSKRRERQLLRKQRINEQYKARIARINTDAGRRGILNSTIVLNQLERAHIAKQEAETAINDEIEFIEVTRNSRIDQQNTTFEQRAEALARRIHIDSVRINVQAIREKAVQRSRAFRDLIHLSQVRLTTPINTQTMIDQEIYDEYVTFLVKQLPRRAVSLVSNDPVFFFNLPHTMWLRLYNEFNRRVSDIT
ncbi:MAG: hypothetical protein FWE45_02635 [Firmicutes bacterium]|nr:hypothetical protein [Bacillota bacterium]